MNVAWFSLMWIPHVSTKMKGAEDCKEVFTDRANKTILSMLLQRLLVLLLVLYLTSIHPNANEKILFITFDSVLKPSKSVFIIYEYGPKCFDSDLFLKISGCSNAFKE